MSTYMPDIATFSTMELVNELKSRNNASLIALVQLDGSVALSGSGGLPARSWLANVLGKAADIETDMVVFGGVGDEDDDEDGFEADADSD